MIISKSGSFSIKLDVVNLTASLKILHHVVKTNVGQLVAAHDPQFNGMKAVWKSFSKALHPLISDLWAPSKIDVEFSHHFLF